MRDIRDENNPHLNNYGPWDLWGYVNEVSNLEMEGVTNIWVDLPGWETLYLSVDHEGWLVPSLDAYRRQMERMKYGAGEESCGLDSAASFVARGVPDQRMLLDLKQAKERIKAQYIPPIPAWLAKAPPESAMLLPGGEVVTLGMVGNQDLVWEGLDAPRRFYRYDADGNLLGRTEPGALWWNLYFDLEGERAKYGDDTGIAAYRPGYVGISYYPDGDESQPHHTVWYTYRGEKTSSPAGHPELTDQTQFMELYMDELLRLYEYQLDARPDGT